VRRSERDRAVALVGGATGGGVGGFDLRGAATGEFFLRLSLGLALGGQASGVLGGLIACLAARFSASRAARASEMAFCSAMRFCTSGSSRRAFMEANFSAAALRASSAAFLRSLKSKSFLVCMLHDVANEAPKAKG
jgi:hypothetical protein